MNALIRDIESWPNVTALWGLTLAERDARFRAAWLPVRAAIEAARLAKRAGEFDASAAGFVWSGDTYSTDREGNVAREFAPISTSLSTEALVFGGTPAGAPITDATVLAQLHALADLSPTATNWLPHRVRVLSETAAQQAGVILDAPRDGALGLLFYRRPRYESLLGDILEVFGMQASAFEEWIDPGIYIETIRLAAEECGLALTLADAKGVHPVAAPASLVAGGDIDQRHLPFLFLRFGGTPKMVSPATENSFARLALCRSSQRVASPTRPLPAHTLAEFTGAQTVWFQSTDPIVSVIGRSMFAGLYGEGADLATKTGGIGGVLASMSPEAAQKHLQVALEDGVAADKIGGYLRERLLEGGRYTVSNGVLTSARGEPMTYKNLTRMTKTFAAAMGSFFLQFHNTHPAAGIVLAEATPMGAFDAGVRAARLLYHARAEGYAAIVKSGPVDLAEAGIARALAEVTHHEGLNSGAVRPALTVQVGWPLADETLGNGVKGLDQRERDLRPPRAHPLTHFFVG